MSAPETLAIGDRGLASFLLAFTVTQLVEVPIYTWALRGARRTEKARSGGSRWGKESRRSAPYEAGAPLPLSRNTLFSRVIIAFGASLLTHPIVWFLLPSATLALHRTAVRAGAPPLDELGRTLLYGVVAEGFAVIAEAFYLAVFRARRPLLWSLAANAASVLIGTLVVRLL